MQVKLISFALSKDLSLFLVPETDVERELLKALWQHGELKVCNGVADRTGQGFCVKIMEDSQK